MICLDVKYYAPLYQSGELDAKTLVDIERHLEGCPHCRNFLEEQHLLDRSIREAVLQESVDASHIRKQVMLHLADVGSAQSAGSSRRYPFWRLMFAAAAMFCVVLFAVRAHSVDRAFYRNAAKDHIDDVVKLVPKQGWYNSDPAVRSYLAAHFGKDGVRERMHLAGYHLVRARDCHIGKEAFMHLIYSDGTQLVSLYVRPAVRAGLERIANGGYFDSMESRTETGYDVTRANSAGRTFVLVGQLPPQQAQKLMGSVVRSLA